MSEAQDQFHTGIKVLAIGDDNWYLDSIVRPSLESNCPGTYAYVPMYNADSAAASYLVRWVGRAAGVKLLFAITGE